MAGVLVLTLAVPMAGQSGAGARLVMVSRKTRPAKAKAGPAVSRAQMELAHEMVRDAYGLGQRLELSQRVALMARLLYTMRPEVMAEEKKQWAEELFRLAQQLPDGGGYAATDAAPAAARGGYAARDTDTRDQAIATAAARVAVYDSDRALELLDTLPSEGGRREDARTMASRLVFAIYMEHHGAAGAQTLLAHGRKWGEHGGFPYGASAAALARLRGDEAAAEDFFRQVLAVFARGQEGVFGVREFAGLLDRATALAAISDESAEEAGRAVVAQLGKLAGGDASGEATGSEAAGKDAAGNGVTGTDWSDAASPLTEEQTLQIVEALNDVRLSAPKAYAQAAKDWPGLVALRAAPRVTAVEELTVDAGLQASFGELAEAMRERSGPEAIREVIARGLQRVNARYKKSECAECAARDAGAGGYAQSRSEGRRLAPDAQSWALVSLAAYAAPTTIAAQLKEIEEPFWHAYFLAIAAQQVGEPTRVADPTARTVPGKEEAEPE